MTFFFFYRFLFNIPENYWAFPEISDEQSQALICQKHKKSYQNRREPINLGLDIMFSIPIPMPYF